MSNVMVGIWACALTFAFGFMGMWLQKLLPDSHMSSGARDMIGAVMGLVALLLALVLGTLVGSAYGFYAGQKANVETMAARAIQLDMALKPFAADGQPLRDQLKQAIGQAYQVIWVDDHGVPPRIEGLVTAFDGINGEVARLKPTTPEQIAAMPSVNISLGIIEQTRLLMVLQLASPISWPLLAVLVSWAMLLFMGYGVLARLNGTAVFAALIGALAIGSAVFLILELNQPFTGLFRIPPVAIQQTLAVLGK